MVSSSGSPYHFRFSEMTRILFRDTRSLQVDFNDEATNPPNGFPNAPTPAPVSSPIGGSNDNQGSNPFLPVLFIVLAVVVFVALYKIYQACRWRREQYLMRLRSVQADQVLGDMQMVPSEDPDAELL